MSPVRLLVSVAMLIGVSACSSTPTEDAGIDSGPLSAMHAGIWVDGNGCDHWIIDDGFEGYMSPRLNRDGTPVCRPGTTPWSTVFFERRIIGDKS